MLLYPFSHLSDLFQFFLASYKMTPLGALLRHGTDDMLPPSIQQLALSPESWIIKIFLPCQQPFGILLLPYHYGMVHYQFYSGSNRIQSFPATQPILSLHERHHLLNVDSVHHGSLTPPPLFLSSIGAKIRE